MGPIICVRCGKSAIDVHIVRRRWKTGEIHYRQYRHHQPDRRRAVRYLYCYVPLPKLMREAERIHAK